MSMSHLTECFRTAVLNLRVSTPLDVACQIFYVSTVYITMYKYIVAKIQL